MSAKELQTSSYDILMAEMNAKGKICLIKQKRCSKSNCFTYKLTLTILSIFYIYSEKKQQKF